KRAAEVRVPHGARARGDERVGPHGGLLGGRRPGDPGEARRGPVRGDARRAPPDRGRRARVIPVLLARGRARRAMEPEWFHRPGRRATQRARQRLRAHAAPRARSRSRRRSDRRSAAVRFAVVARTRNAARVSTAEPPHRALGLTDDEFETIRETLGRDPNDTELAMYGAMWSEHCSYKSSKVHLKTLPTEGDAVLVGPGEDAGVVDIGDGLAAVFKMESHSHPSAIEPYQGAATGVGGIIRDILSMGARPVALLDPLRFGPLTEARNRWLFAGVVAGIGGYGNCIGVPTVGGEIGFGECHGANPTVNVMCV